MYICKGRAAANANANAAANAAGCVGVLGGASHCLLWPRMVFSPPLCELGALKTNLKSRGLSVKRRVFFWGFFPP